LGLVEDPHGALLGHGEIVEQASDMSATPLVA
jgi:hypothetical protein